MFEWNLMGNPEGVPGEDENMETDEEGMPKEGEENTEGDDVDAEEAE